MPAHSVCSLLASLPAEADRTNAMDCTGSSALVTSTGGTRTTIATGVSKTFRLTVTRGAVTGVTTVISVRKRTAGICGKSYGNGTGGSAVISRVADQLPVDWLIRITVKLGRLVSERCRHSGQADFLTPDRELRLPRSKKPMRSTGLSIGLMNLDSR